MSTKGRIIAPRRYPDTDKRLYTKRKISVPVYFSVNFDEDSYDKWGVVKSHYGNASEAVRSMVRREFGAIKKEGVPK